MRGFGEWWIYDKLVAKIFWAISPKEKRAHKMMKLCGQDPSMVWTCKWVPYIPSPFIGIFSIIFNLSIWYEQLALVIQHFASPSSNTYKKIHVLGKIPKKYKIMQIRPILLSRFLIKFGIQLELLILNVLLCIVWWKFSWSTTVFWDFNFGIY